MEGAGPRALWNLYTKGDIAHSINIVYGRYEYFRVSLSEMGAIIVR